MSEEQEVEKTELTKATELLDRLLAVDARRPGAAAKLPAVIRVIEPLEPAGGMGFPVFPASYAGASENDPPIYDLSGIVYGEELGTSTGKNKTTVQRPITKAERCTIDSPQSQANRTEVAFVEDTQLRRLVPQGSARIPRQDGTGEESVLRLPHRIADFRVRISDKRDEVKSAISGFANGDASTLLRLMPTSIVFGFWDSRGEGTQPKHARILLSRIDAFHVVPCSRHAVYSGPYSSDEFAAVILAKPAADKAEKDRMSELGYSNALSAGLGGVLVKDKIERLALISLTDIARLNCRNENGEVDEPKTNAARRYIFALAALAEAYPRSTGSHRLRSGCELVSKLPVALDLRGGDSTYPDGDALKALYNNREMLVALAARAKSFLTIPDEAGTFTVSKDSLKADFPTMAAPTQTPAPTGPPELGAVKSPRRPSKRS